MTAQSGAACALASTRRQVAGRQCAGAGAGTGHAIGHNVSWPM